MNSLYVATWNLNYLSPNSERAKACRAKMAAIQADIWILTETREGFCPGRGFHPHCRVGAHLRPGR